MRYLVAIITTAVATALAKPHGHAHRHGAAKRGDAVVYAPGPVETVVVYELNGHTISEEEVRNGIANGTLTWGEDGTLSSTIAAVSIASTPTPTADTHALENNHVGEEPQPIEQSVPLASKSMSEPESTLPTEIAKTPQYQPVDEDGNCSDCDKEFPNREFDCGEFPAGFGAIHLGNEGLGGWSGIQAPAKRDVNGYHDIMTVPTGSCPHGDCCTRGRFCSYACPNPYLKMSFPKMQGARKESVGGLFCNKDGKLEMADGSLAKTLCGRGSTRMRVLIQSKLSKPVSICRTDYPGTESETLPLTIQPGETKEIANPDQGKYFFWDNKPTSAQYYINNQGVEESRACTWGNGQGDTGNRAPVNLGTSFDDINMNTGFPAIFPNKPTNPDAKLNFAIQFTGDGVSNPCSYKNGQYCLADGKCNTGDGCTSSVADGKTLTVVFTDS
ncbi:Protein BZZ1 [Kalmusia sp. IMI 367209]|nr:Protein BZZ1 [Kalmusia sp. IMI 367209]